MNGRSTSASAGFGWVSVSGRSRVPSPPTRHERRISRSRRLDFGAPDPLVDEAGGPDARGIEEVSAVHEQRVRHPAAISSQASSANCAHSVTRIAASAPSSASSALAADLDAGEHLGARGLGDRVERDHCRALGLEARREHEARRLAHVVRVGLEREAEQGDALADE